MKKRILITKFSLLIIVISLVGCFELAGVPESEEEAKKLYEWSEKELNRLMITVTPTVDVYDEIIEDYVPNKQVCLDILATAGYHNRFCKDTKENGFINFDPVTMELNAGEEISVTARSTIVNNSIDRTYWLSYSEAKDKAKYTNETRYTYSWNVHFKLINPIK